MYAWDRGYILIDTAVTRASVGKESHETADAVAVCNFQKFLNVSEECVTVGTPHLVMKEYADAVESEFLGPTKFFVDFCRVPRGGLPHLNLIAGVCRDIVAAHRPVALGVPGIGLFLGPALCNRFFTVAGGGESRREGEN